MLLAMRRSRPKHTWTFHTSAPPREVFAVMEQSIGTPPYQFRVVSDDEAEIVEVERCGFFGHWTTKVRRPQWVGCRAHRDELGTVVTVRSSAPRRTPGRRSRAPESRALQLIGILSRGDSDRRTIYRDRTIPPGPVTLVASWAGTPYRLFTAPKDDAPRGAPIHTATRVQAVSAAGPRFVAVRLPDGTEGYVERDQIVPAPPLATRDAQAETARFG